MFICEVGTIIIILIWQKLGAFELILQKMKLPIT